MKKTYTETLDQIPTRIKVFVFIFAFIALLVDGADLMLLAYSLTSLTADFNLTPTQAGSLGTFTLAGMAIGGIYGGWACDRFGRVTTIMWSMIIFSVGTACLGLSNGYWAFAIIRFFSALGIGSLYISCNTLVSEYVSTKYRTTILGTLQAGWSVGYVVATLFAGWIIPEYGWRVLFYLAILPVGVGIIMRKMVPESPSWHAAKALRETEQKQNNNAQITDAAHENNQTVKTSSFKLLIADKVVLRIFIFWTFATAFFQFGYYGVSNWMPAYLEKELHMNFKAMTGYMVGSFTAMIFGKIMAGILADYLGRRTIYVLSSIATALFIPLIIFYNTPDNILLLLVIFGFLYGMPVGVLGTYMTESFPGKIRGFAVGGAYNAGRIGAAIAPITIGFIATITGNIGMSFLLLGVAYFATGVIPGLFIRSKLYDPSKE